MIQLKSRAEIERMRVANRIVAEVHDLMSELIVPGITSAELDRRAEEHIRSVSGAVPAFKGYRGYPATLCVSVNDVVVHGIPNEQPLREGDIVGIDCGVRYDDFFGDAARTFAVGRVDSVAERLMRVTEESLHKGIDAAVVDARLFDISAAVQAHAETHGFSVVRDFVGHGIGYQLHEDPQVPNYGQAGRGVPLKEGMVLALEPMINEGSYEVTVDEDGWTARTRDGKRSAHFEHTVAVTADGPDILSLA